MFSKCGICGAVAQACDCEEWAKKGMFSPNLGAFGPRWQEWLWDKEHKGEINLPVMSRTLGPFTMLWLADAVKRKIVTMESR